MWRTAREPYQRHTPRPYPTTRPKVFTNNPCNNRTRLAPQPHPNPFPFSRDPPPTKSSPFGAFHFKPPPMRYAPHAPPITPIHLNPMPPKADSTAKKPRVNDPSPKDAPHASSLVTARGPSVSIPGAFPTAVPEQARVVEPRVGTGPQRVKAQAKNERRQRKRPRDEEEDCEVVRLKKSVRFELGEEEEDAEVQAMMAQLNSLHVNYNYRTQLFKCRETAQRAADEAGPRAEKMAERDAAVEKRVGEEETARAEIERLAREREKRKQERERERVLAQQRASEAREKERLKRWVEELAEKGRREERERTAREEREREEARRRAEDDAAADRAFQESIRRAREVFLAGDATTIQHQLDEYDGKWVELRDGRPLPPLSFGILPWPVLGAEVTSPADITLERVQEFVFHPMRKGLNSKSRRDRVRAEMLKWHPDKFDAKVLSKVIDAVQVTEAAGHVARFLTQIMEQETTQER